MTTPATPLKMREKVAPPTEEEMKKLMTHVDVPERLSCADWFGFVVIVPLAPFTVVVLVATMLLSLAPLVLTALFQYFQPGIVRAFERGAGFWAICALVMVLSTPSMVLAVVWAVVVNLVFFIFSAPVGLFRWQSTAQSLRTLWPYMGRPGDSSVGLRSPADKLAEKHGCMWSFADIFCAIAGAVHRQGISEVMIAVPLMVTIIPLYKWLLCNPFIYTLKEVYINQRSEPLDVDGDGNSNLKDQYLAFLAMRRLVCNAKIGDINAHIVDAWPFTGHHQFPPPGRESKTVAGLQMGMGGYCTLISHTTHPYDVEGHKPRSESAAHGVIVVRLQAWNPWYQLAGYVEVNVRKDNGVEHPMWLCADPSSKTHMNSCLSINKLFVTLGKCFAAYLREQPEFQDNP
ncbi:unnamed protein product [Symbiodinium natans]|uniref:Uncharacterized protein n=1 Tax=Symbiodinium natans TaxID=878477 RepID=A0A812SMK4_9DINO|nr:unnamed protein product [Symbiodinium natans]